MNTSVRRWYLDKRFDKLATVLLPGEFLCSAEDKMLVTVLGSCIAVCLFDTQSRVGGLNHFLLPGEPHNKKQVDWVSDFSDESARYGHNAMELLINGCLKLGAKKEQLVAKIFGGAHVTPSMNKIGDENILFAREFLHSESIPVVVNDIGGVVARKIFFHAHFGDVFVKKLQPSTNIVIANEEAQYQKQIKQSASTGEIDFF